MLLIKLILIALLFALFLMFAVRLMKRGLSKRYEPRSKTPWNSLSEGEDPSL